MKLSINNFLYGIRQIVTGGGRHNDGSPYNDSGYLRRAEGVSLSTMLPSANLSASTAALTLTNMEDGSANNTLVAIGDTSTTNQSDNIELNFDKVGDEINALISDVAAIRNAPSGVADETNAKVYKVEEGQDTVGTVRWQVPRDYDEETDELTVRVLASMVSVSTDDDVELDAQVYKKTAGSALGSDLDPTKPGTVLSTTEQWLEFDLGDNSLARDDVLFFTLITNGANDTNGEEVLIHDLEFLYRSTLVSYDEEDSSGNSLR